MIRGLLRTRRAKLIAVVAAVLVLAGSAAAYWTTSGSGTAAAQTGTAQPVTIAAGSPTTQLYPGGSADVAATISNPNSFPAHVPSLLLDTSQGTGGFGVDSGHAGCAVSALSFTGSNNGGSGYLVPAKSGATNGSLPVDLTGALSMSAAAANACQGATFSVFLKVGP